MIASQTSAIRTIAPPPPVVAPITVTSSALYDIAQLGERLDVPIGQYGDGPTNYQCNKSLQFKWPTNSNNPSDAHPTPPYAVAPWGSWIDAAGVQRGSTAFASATIPSSGALPLSITWDITTLMRKLVVSNTGVYITPETAGIGAAAAFASMQYTDDSTKRPTFHIVTSAGTFDVGAKVDSTISQGSTDIGMDPTMRDPYCIKPDLSTVQGIITSATLTLWDVGGSQLRPCRYDCYYLDMPVLVGDPVRQLGGVQQGIAASVTTNDLDLAGHPSVIFYPSFDSITSAALTAAGWINVDSTITNLESVVPWVDYGLNAIRLVSSYTGHTLPGPDGSTIISWRKFLPTAGSSTYKELYVRYLMKIDPDVFYGMNEGGVKLPGFGGDDRNTVPIPQPNIWSYRMEHDKQSVENHGAYSWWIHAYDTDNQVQDGFAQNRPTSQSALIEGRIYCVEQHVKMNTKTGSTFNADGIVQIWLNGVLVSNDTTRRIAQSDGTDFIDNFFANFFHGGSGTPTQRIHYEFGGVCIATQYIGPPKRPTSSFPSWRPPAGFFADIPSSNIPSDVFSPLYGAGAWAELAAFWTGGAFVRDYSKLGAFVLHGSGHEIVNVQGTLTFDFSAGPSSGKWEYHNAPTQSNIDSTPNYNAAGEFADTSLFAQHTYLGFQELPTSWGGGPKGSVVTFASNGGTLPGGLDGTSHKIDLSQATLGYARLTGGGFAGGTYPMTEIDEGRQGWWVSNGGTHQMRFVSKSGAAGASLAASASFFNSVALVLWPSKNVLIQIPECNHEGGNTSFLDQLYIYDIATNTEQIVSTTGRPLANRPNAAGAGQEMLTLTPASGGTGYVVGDTIIFNTSNATLPQNYPKVTVTAVGAGGSVVSTSFFNFPHPSYTMPQRGWLNYPPPSNPLSQFSTSGIGTGATFNATWQVPNDTFQPWFCGLCWCEPLRCIVGFDPYTVEIVTLTPPVGDIYASAWTYARLSVSHWAAGDPSGQSTLNPGQNGPYSKFRYIPTLNAFVLFGLVTPSDGSYHPPQIINLPGL